MRKIVKFFIKTLFIVLGLIILYLIAAFVLSRITIDKEITSIEEIEIYILTNGVYTDIVLPIETNQIKYEHIKSRDAAYKYIAFGWGDRSFYLETPTWSDLKISTAFNATFGISATAIHATYYKEMKENNSCRKILISKNQYARLINFIQSSFKKDSAGEFINIKTNDHYGDSDAFYEAHGSYSLFNTCNTWANNGLKVSGQKCCLWTAFDTGIFLKYN